MWDSRRLIVALLLLAPALTLQAQADWTTVNQEAVWVNAFVDHGLSSRTALWFDGHLRRDGLGERPQQLLLRPGFQVTVRPGLRIAAGYAYIATAPYGESPNGHWWNLFYGLAGYSRKGSSTKMRAMWIPIQLSGQD